MRGECSATFRRCEKHVCTTNIVLRCDRSFGIPWMEGSRSCSAVDRHARRGQCQFPEMRKTRLYHKYRFKMCTSYIHHVYNVTLQIFVHRTWKRNIRNYLPYRFSMRPCGWHHYYAATLHATAPHAIGLWRWTRTSVRCGNVLGSYESYTGRSPWCGRILAQSVRNTPKLFMGVEWLYWSS